MSATDKTTGETIRQAVGNQIITNYESLSLLTSQMRDAALHGEWDQLVRLEQQCSQHVVTMKTADAGVELDGPSRLRKIELIKGILADDAVIRSRTEKWIVQLQSIMQSNRHEQRLHQAYGI